MQHMSILPLAAQIAWKLGTLVGTGDAVIGQVSTRSERAKSRLKAGRMTYGLHSQDPQFRARQHHNSSECRKHKLQ